MLWLTYWLFRTAPSVGLCPAQITILTLTQMLWSSLGCAVVSRFSIYSRVLGCWMNQSDNPGLKVNAGEHQPSHQILVFQLISATDVAFKNKYRNLFTSRISLWKVLYPSLLQLPPSFWFKPQKKNEEEKRRKIHLKYNTALYSIKNIFCVAGNSYLILNEWII